MALASLIPSLVTPLFLLQAPAPGGPSVPAGRPAAPAGPSAAVLLVAGLPGDVPTDRPVEARRGERVTLHVVLRVGAGWRARYYSEAPAFVLGRSRLMGRRVSRLAPLGVRVSWLRVEPQQHHVATPSPNKGNPAYSNAVLFGPRHGAWLGYDTLEYYETPIPGVTGPTLVVDRARPAHPKVDVHGGLGTMRYKAVVTWGGRVLASPGAEAVGTLGIRADVLRVSFREADDFIGYLTSYYNVPNVFGSAGPGMAHQTEQFQGADCADVLVGGARRAGASMAYTSAAGLRHLARVVSPRLLLDRNGITYLEGPRKGQRAALRFGTDVQRGDLMLIDYAGWNGSSRTWDHVAAVARDAGRKGWFDPADRVMHMGYLWGLVEAPAASEGPAIVQFLRFAPRYQWAFRWHQKVLARERARRAVRLRARATAEPRQEGRIAAGRRGAAVP